jgi:putative heme degradation protein
VVTSVEVFDGKGRLMAMFFFWLPENPVIPEQQARDIAARLPWLAT